MYGVGWAGPGSLAVVYQNRAQNCSYHAVCSHPHYRCYKVGQWRYNRDREIEMKVSTKFRGAVHNAVYKQKLKMNNPL